jgi:glucose/arabinose dehydrogenase
MTFRALFIVGLGLTVAAIVVAFRPQARPRQLARGFSEHVTAAGLTLPTAFRFSPDGRIFVAEKSGRILVFDRPGDPRPTLFADLSREVYDVADHGLLGLALDPAFPRKPYVYVLYSFNAAIGGKAPRWPTGGGGDICPDPPGLRKDGCVTSGRLSVLTAQGDHMVGPERVLINDWCSQSSTHSVGDLAFEPGGALIVSGGDGAEYAFADYGQRGRPPNPCGDPPGHVGVPLAWPTSQGGALRAQDLRTPGDSVTLDGAILRVNPATGQGWPTNPLARSPDANARRIIAYGFKQPFRFTIRPGTDEVWVGDVGHNQWEEIDRVIPSSRVVPDYGWPCYEGPYRQHDYSGATQIATFDVCKALYAAGPSAVVLPYFAYRHHREIVRGDGCPPAAASISGLAFGRDAPYPGGLANALFFADASRGCIWVLPPLPDGLPDPTNPEIFIRQAGIPVDLQIGPGGNVYYLDYGAGQIRRVDYAG